MYPLFNYGVIRKSEQLTRLGFKIDRIIQAMEGLNFPVSCKRPERKGAV